MKKFYFLGLLAAGALSASASGLPTPTFLEPVQGATVATFTELREFILDFGQEVEFVNPSLITSQMVQEALYAASDYQAQTLIEDEEYGLVTVTSDNPMAWPQTQQVMVRLYSAGESGAGDGLPSTGITCLGFSMDEGSIIGMFNGDPAGNYTITIPADFVQAVGNPDLTNDDFSYTFKVLGITYAAATFTPTPNNLQDSGEEVLYTPQELSAVKIQWNENGDNMSVALASDEKTGIVLLSSDAGSTRSLAVAPQYVSTTEDALVIDLSWVPNGYWALTIPKGFVILDGEFMNPEEQASYYVGMLDIPATYFINGSLITVQWKGATNLKVNANSGIQIVGEGESMNGIGFNLSSNEITVSGTDNSELLIDLSGINDQQMPSGYYRLVIPENAVNMTYNGNEIACAGSYFTFDYVNNNTGDDEPGDDEPGDDEPGDGPTVGIAGIQADANGNFTVYNLQGVKVMQGADLNGLNKGLYIINGKKVVVK